MTQSLEWNSNTTRAVLAAATALTAFVAYNSLVLSNPIRKLPKALIKSPSQYIYDPSQSNEEGKKYPKLEQSRFVGSAAVIVNDAELAHQILLRQDRYKPGHAYGRSPTIADFHAVLLGGANIANATGEDWRIRRDTLVPQFQTRIIMSDILPSVISKTEAMINDIKAQGDELVDINYHFVKLTSDVICDYIFGETPQPGEVTFRSFDKPAQSMLKIKLKALLDVFGLKSDSQLEIERNTRFALRAIQKVKRGQSKCINGSPTLCERLLQYKEYQGPEGEARLSQELLIMVFAGHDTTAHSLTILSYVLSQVPECVDKIRQEVERIVPTTADMTAAKLSKLEYTSAAIKESLRLHPLVDILLVQSYEDNMIDGLPVAKGTGVMIPAFRIQRDPTIFKKPLAYLPERWLEEDLQLQQDLETVGSDKSKLGNAFLTFSAGTHACLGMNLAYLELRVATALLVKNFDWEYNGPVPQNGGFLLRLKDKLMLKFKPRATN
ncbi:hypothetical protein NQZ79_g25 [Umbelopsis isabellina]|nr:hypothetical protein NQZ79_g25 [Umbelopsis isabellina]